MQQPPLLVPDDTPARVHRLARLDGLSIVLVAAIGAIAAALHKNALGATIGLAVAGAGMMELHGADMLRAGYARGMRWLIGAQLFLLAVLWAFCAYRLLHTDLTETRAAFQASLEVPGMKEKWAEAQRSGITEDLYVLIIYRLTYLALMGVTFVYQGGMALYYFLKRKRVEQALAEEEPEV